MNTWSKISWQLRSISDTVQSSWAGPTTITPRSEIRKGRNEHTDKSVNDSPQEREVTNVISLINQLFLLDSNEMKWKTEISLVKKLCSSHLMPPWVLKRDLNNVRLWSDLIRKQHYQTILCFEQKHSWRNIARGICAKFTDQKIILTWRHNDKKISTVIHLGFMILCYYITKEFVKYKREIL